MTAEPLLCVEGLFKSFSGRAALRNVSLKLERGRALGLVGVSGSGKSTLVRCVAGFETFDAGRILIDGRPGCGWRAGVQLVFQEAALSLNPRFTAEELVTEPLVLQGIGNRLSRRKSAAELLEMAGLPADAARKSALAFSGGERQRLAIARALAARPAILILDESFSGLDLILQAQLTDLLRDLRRRLHLTCILVSHDIALAGRIADDLAVMDNGEIVEQASTVELLTRPRHPRSRDLVEAALLLALQDSRA
jgi:ABC-type dipeptide/oligopeptide/nickel transport system ATPase subunit